MGILLQLFGCISGRYKILLVTGSVLAFFSGGCGSGGEGVTGDAGATGDTGISLSCANTGTDNTVTISWNSPEANTDGTLITDLSGYRVYYGTQSGDYSTAINVGETTTYQITNLSPGNTYYFTVTAYDSSMNESGFSNEACKSIE